jgi:outer membrane lipase/esterase
MRNSPAPGWARSAVFTAALTSAITAFAPSASAQQKFDQLFIFGDSYTDTALAGLWRVYPLPLADNLKIPPAQIVEFGVGGARASPIGPPAVVPPGWHLLQQVDAYLAGGSLVGPRDLVTLNIGGNDGLALLNNIGAPGNNVFIGYPGVSLSVGNASTFAGITADYATAQIQRLVDSGARNFVLGEFSGLSGLPVVPGVLAPIADAYGKAYFDAMQTRMAPLGESGIRIFMFDLFRLGVAVNADPAKYGFVGFNCPGAPPICGGSIASPQQFQYYLGPDGLHLTSGGFALVAEYMANIVMAPDTIAVQPGLVATTTSGFTATVLGRLDAARAQSSLAALQGDGPMGLGNKQGRGPAAPASRFTTYSIGTFQGGSRSDSFDLVGYEYDITSGTAGIEYRVNPNLIVGIAGNYTTGSADLNSGASIDTDAVQAALYVSHSTRHWFADALVGFGHHDLDLARPGVIDFIRSSTDATSFAAAAKAGYLWDLGGVRAGPIAGLTYTHARVGAYTEKGDPLLTYKVSAQTIDMLTGSVGVQFRAPFMAGGNAFNPFLNITLEHQLGDDNRTMTGSLLQAPLVPILSPVANFEDRTYGKIEGGVVFEIGPSVSATVNAASTFGRDDGNDYRISAGFNYRF